MGKWILGIVALIIAAPLFLLWGSMLSGVVNDITNLAGVVLPGWLSAALGFIAISCLVRGIGYVYRYIYRDRGAIE